MNLIAGPTMRVPFYNIKAQYEELSSQLDQVVHEVISGGAYVMGPHHKKFEEEMAKYQGVKHAIAVNSGTDALRISYDAAGFGPGDEVITTAFTFVASVETIVQTGATPVFVDIDETTFQMDPAKLEAAITPRTRGIVPIHLFGQMCDMERIMAIAAKHNLVVVEDAAQAIGATRNGKYAGSYGVAAGLSFYVTKNLGAAGDGGMIITNSDEIAEKCRSIRVHGMGRERYYYDYLGYTSRLDEIQAAIMAVKLTKLNEWNQRRAKLAAVYQDLLREADVVTPQLLEGNTTTWHQYTIRTSRRDELQAHLKESGIDSMIYYPVPIHYHEPYKRFAKGQGSLPVTEKVSLECLSLPIHQHLTVEEVTYVANMVKALLPKSAAAAR
ncbi:MAG: DegT/DnrJ/EryC1/StrS family aminotransferase [Armatimonadetes bacterium]|nr:DegT/DnrJ/EryC1/StrS family aminotransferase [Armatimonadota bacterium]